MKTTIVILALICLGGVYARTAGNACLAGQVKVENAICVACSNHKGCAECTAFPLACTACSAGWTLVDKQCVKNEASCAEPLCDISGTQGCATCAKGFRPAMKDTASTSYCVACTQGNCSACTVDECTECNAGFFLQDKACVACGANCAACTAADACTTCATGFFGTGTCTACSTGCAECSAADVCTKCLAGNVLATATNTCVAKDGCEEAADETAAKCKTCADGYRLLADGTCKACDANAQTCDGSGTDQTILTCKVDMILASATATVKAACSARTDGYCLKQDAAGVCSKCQSGWYVSKGKCVSASSIDINCKDANDGTDTTAATCKTCNDNAYGSTTTPMTCTACNSSCAGCTATGCTACAKGYYKASATATTCSACEAGGADQCTFNNASSCKPGYGLQEHGICFACDPSYNCKTCSAYQQCSTCATGSWVSTADGTAGQCVKCGVQCTNAECSTGPDTCSNGGCKTGYVINSVTKKCEDAKVCAVANCSICDTADYSKCQVAVAASSTPDGCKSGYYSVAGVCTACSAGCGKCTGTTKALCTECKDGKIKNSTDGSNSCDNACGSTVNTISCTNADGLTATAAASRVCASGNTASADNLLCLACTLTGCSVCTTSNTAVTGCTTCKDGFHTPATGGCTACATGAATCSATAHTSCVSGYVLGTSTGAGTPATCYKTPLACTTSAGAALPTSGTADTQISADEVCGGTSVCQSGYLKNATSNKCEKCTTANCATCSPLATCTACATGYKLTSSKTCILATTIPNGCLTPTAAEWDKCDTCATGYYKTSATATSCTQCAGGCACTSATDCTACADTNHYYNSAADPKTCTACSVANCATCSATAADICDTCKSGFFAEGTDKKKCTACSSDCLTCTNATDCSVCKDTYFLFTLPTVNNVAATSVKYCAMCASNCKACTVKTDGSQTCDECNAGFYLSADKKSCSSADCSGTDGKTCNKCLYGKVLKDGKCADCTGDNSCPASCTASSNSTTTTPVGAGNGTAATDSSSKIAFSLLVLAFFAILGHMMI